MSPASTAAILLIWLARISSGDIPVNPKQLSGEISLEAPAVLPAGVPATLHVRFTNTSAVTLRYRCYEIHAWPPAWLTARLSRDAVVREVGLGNGQDTAWPLGDDDDGSDGVVFAIGSGQASEFPVILPQLEAGDYELHLSGHPCVSGHENGPTVVDWPGVRMRGIVRLTVRADQQAARTHDEELLKRIERGEVLAFHMATYTRNARHAQAMVPFVLNIDPRVALKAAEAMRKLEDFPADADAVVAEALVRWSYSNEDGAYGVRDELGHVASSLGSNLLLDTCAELARTDKRQRLHHVQVVARFPHQRATRVLHEFVGDPDQLIHDTVFTASPIGRTPTRAAYCWPTCGTRPVAHPGGSITSWRLRITPRTITRQWRQSGPAQATQKSRSARWPSGCSLDCTAPLRNATGREARVMPRRESASMSTRHVASAVQYRRSVVEGTPD